MPIHFYLKNGPFGFLSNFSAHPVRVQDEVWPTVEHFYQAAKFVHEPAIRAQVRAAQGPLPALRIARHYSGRIRADWASVKDAVMLEGLRAKFAQHPELRDALLATGDEELAEHSHRDSYWGDGGDGTGQNRLGKLLMQVRQEARRSSIRRDRGMT